MKFLDLAASLLLAPTAAAKDSSILTVKTTSGTYTGFVNSTTPDVNQWLGIPFGQPPVGSLRFMPPLKALDYGKADAGAYKPICMQDSGNRTGAFWELVPEFQNTDAQSEDCLYLNIWAPRKPVVDEGMKEKKLPVIIWVCGGSFKEGGGHANYQVPDQWIQRTQTHMVVTFNYRLGLFGFPGSPVANKNVGLMDVRLVVEWLADNVEGFGGDPHRMTLYGQSAGAAATLFYGYANPEKPIVGGLIASSVGTAETYPTNVTRFHNLAQIVGCANLSDMQELTCMQNLTAVDLQAKMLASNWNPTPGPIQPVADGVTVFANMTDRLERGLVAKIPLITGYTFNEPVAFAPFNISATSPTPTDGTAPANPFACGVKREMSVRLQYGLTTYRYLYAGNFTNITPRYWLGGMHSSDIPLVFGTHYEYRGNSTELEWQTSYAIESFWVSFTSNPSVDPRNYLGQSWPKYTSTARDIVVFGNASLPSASSLSPDSVADYYSGPC
ncbi:Alpha/Beta hydrolase protein [Apodospora peruviana]|uniref:Carboxylic ester hydrolase n=1 Tax=Apodospora peruviana TaxID=516989 RepID=A0AAE0M0N6_9PEZI|nr:Alpha/Beta hydrolase protein [Apodospora peruviana]